MQTYQNLPPHINAKTIVEPTAISIAQELETSFEDAISQLHKASGGKSDWPELGDLAADYLSDLELPTAPESKLPSVHDIRKMKRKYRGLILSPSDKKCLRTSVAL